MFPPVHESPLIKDSPSSSKYCLSSLPTRDNFNLLQKDFVKSLVKQFLSFKVHVCVHQ